ncbi:MAG: ATP-dependent DNA ligase [Deltaproteobacteria bacterium]|nr:MAG: ATP-dependent DNA ligase [Deltaproteobacteria bacterium]PIE73313.1 MAG: ATP-dependent DNA ligase [Deltaproteobacteria bacterium]
MIDRKIAGILQLAVAGCLFVSTSAMAHFGMLIPDQPIVDQEETASEFLLAFSHPFEGHAMHLAKPKKFKVLTNAGATDLTDELQQTRYLEQSAWKMAYTFKRPGVYQFIMEPQAYWEPAEDLSIIHYTKVVVPAFGDDEGWDQPAGLPTEIVPLTRPFGNYAGNSFTGQVLVQGKPSANAEVEVEFYNQNQRYAAPSDYHVTQVVKADANGVFTFTCPLPGWWGFAALTEADYTIKNPEGEDKGVELGAVFWTYFTAPQTK